MTKCNAVGCNKKAVIEASGLELCKEHGTYEEEPLICQRCSKELNRRTAVILELDTRTGTFTDKLVPQEHSQGGFWFGKDCAKEELARHWKVTGAKK